MIRIVTITIALITSGAVLAQGGGSGTPEDQAACSSSVKKFCAQAIQGGDMVVLACLQQNRTQISKACQGVLIKYGQ